MNIEDLLNSVSGISLPEDKILPPLSLFFSQFLEANYKRDRHNLYIIWKGKQALYVGISKTDIWGRWFSGSYGHMMFIHQTKRWIGNSSIGSVIERNFPKSLKWKVELRRYSTFSWTDNEKLEMAEQRLIRELRPLFNSTYRSSLTDKENELIERLTHAQF
jgi:hypothetical protein